MSVELHVREIGGVGPPLVVLHGLYGSSRNWMTAGKGLSERFRVLALDLRNHGESPHRSGMSYEAMAGDVLRTLDSIGVKRFLVMGHSLGGKVAMALACSAPERVEELYVLDIAPREYRPDTGLLDALLSIDLSRVSRRAEAEEQVVDAIPDRALRLFLLTNLVRGPEGGPDYVWQADLEELRRGMAEIRADPLGEDDRYDGPTTFVVGGRSGYVREDDRAEILRHFPRARIVRLEGVGHNVHTEAPEQFLDVVFETAGDDGRGRAENSSGMER